MKTVEAEVEITNLKESWNYDEVVEIAENARDHGKRHGDILWNEFIKNIK